MPTVGKPTVISTFCGTGGSSLGYHWADFKELLAIDFDDHAVECFRLNFPEVPCWKRSVMDVTGTEIMDFCKIRPGELDVFDGSPPCQGFSTAGKRDVRDPRNDLFNHYVRLVTELQPKVFVMENVSGMVKGIMKGRFIEIMNVLKTGNYNVKCKLMNAMYYGVPQSRQRLIFIGVRKDLNREPEFPIPSKKLTTVRQAFSKLKDIGNIPIKIDSKMNEFIMHLKPGENHPKHFSLQRLSWDKPCPTITKTVRINGGAQYIHPGIIRNLTINEAKVLCSFPETWKLTGSYIEQWSRLGNAVMPKFMQAIADTIKKEILGL